MSSSNAGLSSARAYTSTSGATTSAVSVGSFTSGSSSALSHELKVQGRLSASFAARVAGLPGYEAAMRKAGDVWFHVADDGAAGHTNMTCSDNTKKVDSVDPDGVRTMPISKDRHRALVYRFHDENVARSAALLAESWAGAVKYSDGAGGSGITFRVLGAVFGSSNFGVGAQARLLKYRSRAGQAPKNVICSEMCILAFQLCMSESDAGFIKMDAKHSLPSTLMTYFDGPGAVHWRRIAFKA